MSKPGKQYRNRFFAALAGTVAVALCCFTLALVLLLAGLGLSSLTPYLDMVLLPALLILIIIAVRSYRKWKASQE
ncbi:mercury resistance system transport protein MerF [Paucidesulfovibrio longus]|uniref:mercury resistance system transport protein MerF n=1 Tax=Paucidesulfovibrio longus TaxID=889 RepID=UPI0003B35622|nr:mercury resistance system transport protein MerF [Paucidesulfovibrio longus]